MDLTRKLCLTLALIATLFATSCATMFASKTSSVVCNSNPVGATVSLDGMPVGTTPCTVTLRTAQGKGEITLSHVDFGDAKHLFHAKKTTSGWIVANGLLGLSGILTLGIDLVSGAGRPWRDDTFFVDFAAHARATAKAAGSEGLAQSQAPAR